MNRRTNMLMKDYKPQVAIMVYYSGDVNDYYLESHNINGNGEILEGKPLLQETIEGMVNVFFDEQKNRVDFKGMFPENLLQFSFLGGGYYKMIWHTPAMMRVVHFAKQLNLPTEKIWVPATIYKVDRKQLSVYSYIEENRPTETTMLFKPPYFNVSDVGNVCLGNAKVAKPKENTYQNLIKYWEDLFWLSEFSHINGSNKTKSPMNEVWQQLIKSNIPFPNDELLPMIKIGVIQKQLKDIL